MRLPCCIVVVGDRSFIILLFLLCVLAGVWRLSCGALGVSILFCVIVALMFHCVFLLFMLLRGFGFRFCGVLSVVVLVVVSVLCCYLLVWLCFCYVDVPVVCYRSCLWFPYCGAFCVVVLLLSWWCEF